MEELKLRLPTALRYMVESHKHKICYFNLTGAHGPDRFAVLFHWAALMFNNKPSDGFGHILCEFRTCNRPRRVAEIPCGDLTTPWLIAWPVKADRDRRSTLLKHWFVAPYEFCKATMQGVPQGYSQLIGLRHIKEDTWLELDLFNVTTSVTRGVGLISLLWHHGASLVLAEWDDAVWFRR